MNCKIDNWSCIYHACMSNDCQKEVMLDQDADYGPGKCEKEVEELSALEANGYSFEKGV